MKKFYCVLLFLGILSANAQRQRSGSDIKLQEIDRIAQQEEAAWASRNLAVNGMSATDITVASNNFDINFYRCQWQLTPAQRYITGQITSYYTIVESTDNITFDLVHSLRVDSVLHHGNKLTFQQTPEDGVVIRWPAAFPAGTKDSVTICYQGVPVNVGAARYEQGTGSISMYTWTLSEPYGAKGWWPCKNGLTDKADSLDIVITIPDIFTSSTNGLLVRETVAGGKKTSHFQHRYPIATYLVAIAVCKYVIYKDSVLLEDRQMPVWFYSVARDLEFFKPGTAEAKRGLLLFSKAFGTYPFYKEKYCQTYWDIGGGMEHQTNSFLNSIIPSLVVHELGHQWFGDMVTCGSWQDLWLNEGFATYCDWLYHLQYYPSVMRPKLLGALANIVSIPGGSVYVSGSDTADHGRLFSGRLTYRKGGYAVRMLEWVLGDSVFFRGVRAYLADPAIRYGFAKTPDLKRHLEQQSGKDLTTFFNKWIYGEGYPSYQLKWNQNQNRWAHIKLGQTTSHASVSFYDMPVAVQFKNADHDTIIVLNHQFSGQEFDVHLDFRADTVLIDPDLRLISAHNTSVRDETIITSPVVNEIKIFPNPAPTQLYISIRNPTEKKLSLQLYNSAGQFVYQLERELPGYDEQISIPLAQLARGTYWLKLRMGKDLSVLRKIVH